MGHLLQCIQYQREQNIRGPRVLGGGNWPLGDQFNRDPGQYRDCHRPQQDQPQQRFQSGSFYFSGHN